MNILEVNGLIRNQGDFTLGPINLSVPAGTVMGLVGANGAGKTTLFHSLMGVLKPSEGKILFDGALANDRHVAWKKEIGYVSEHTPFFEHWSGKQNLQALKQFYLNWSDQTVKQMAHKFDLDLEKKVRHYSKGQRTKLAIISALARTPKLLFLDEPSSGLDPMSRDVLLEVLFEQLDQQQPAIIYATHYIAEIEQIADQLCFINEGQLLRQDVKEDVFESWRRITFRSDKALPILTGCEQLKSDIHHHEVISSDYSATLEELKNHHADAIETSRLTLEQISVRILRQSRGV